jgi:hypothetical protein
MSASYILSDPPTSGLFVNNVEVFSVHLFSDLRDVGEIGTVPVLIGEAALTRTVGQLWPR